MHHLGSLKDEKTAIKIISRLRELGVECQYSLQEGQYQIFVQNEADLERALDVFRVVLGMPPLKFEVAQEWERIRKIPMGNLTLNLIVACVGIYLLKYTSFNESVKELLLISDPNEAQAFSKITQGQFWRLFTPALLHFNFFHILFNMLWLKDLGKIIEFQKGSVFFLVLVIVSAIASNVLQYLTNGPLFGGMSGVVYAMLGYLWMHKIFDEEFKFGLPKEDLVLMIIWFLVCMTGLFGPVANVAHGVGLGVGMFMGMIVLKGQCLRRPSQFALYAVLALVLPALSIGVELFKRSM